MYCRSHTIRALSALDYLNLDPHAMLWWYLFSLLDEEKVKVEISQKYSVKKKANHPPPHHRRPSKDILVGSTPTLIPPDKRSLSQQPDKRESSTSFSERRGFMECPMLSSNLLAITCAYVHSHILAVMCTAVCSDLAKL